MNTLIKSILFVISVIVIPICFADSNTALDIIKQSEKIMKSKTEMIKYKMELISESGDVEQTRTVRSYFKKYSEKEVSLQKFDFPPVIESSGMMIIDRNALQNDIWMYMPATRRLRRLSGTEKSNWYMGTEFAYEDFEGYQDNKYKFTILSETSCLKTERCYLIEAYPDTDDEKKESGYGKKVYWIETKSLYPVRVQLFNKNMLMVVVA